MLRPIQLTLALATVLSAACEIATPFSGPGFEAGEVSLETDSETVIIGLTNAVLSDDGALRGKFDEHVGNIEASLQDQPGFIGYSLRTRLFGAEVWTMTAWADEEAMLNFVAGEVHATAIMEGGAAIDFGRFHHVEVNKSEVPITWERALELLEADGPAYAE